MSDLTDLQIGEFKAHLAQRLRELKAEIREALIQSDRQHHKDLAGSVADAGDEAVADMLVDLDIALADRHVVELRDVEAALKRIRDGSFGVCIDCGTAIGHREACDIDMLKIVRAARRRGWLAPADVLNTRTLAAVKPLLERTMQ